MEGLVGEAYCGADGAAKRAAKRAARSQTWHSSSGAAEAAVVSAAPYKDGPACSSIRVKRACEEPREVRWT